MTKNDARVEVRALLYVKVNETAEDVLRVARTLGCAAASDPKRIQELFAPRFLEEIKIVTASCDKSQLALAARDSYKDDIMAAIGTDLNGFKLDELVLEQIELRER